ncbi:hypothetical protein M4I21_15185 [Cellulophaga sp. 20_2_10]|uniref:hypothetical protein n=1 Tax=Cellulophaga sp. 20_2_10 TaxID=2942476 RepID=UPI00201AE162|nr:hypothetical protein [Cellulophaga sp. 20_2_10]MCL5247165.1 hypothetical protein [Cellulophaga sp. 20_2_10]
MDKFEIHISPEIINQIKIGIEKYESLQKKDGFIKLANLGWYVNGKTSLTQASNLMDLAHNGKVSDINNYLTNYYKKELSERIFSFDKFQSKRSFIIKEAVECHLSGKYYASVPLFLPQADGLCSKLLFKTKDRKRELKQLVKGKIKNDFFLNILNSVLRTNKIDEYFSDDFDTSTGLNRHAVLHGYDTDYGTELNSLKAFSLLLFIYDFLIFKNEKS